MSTWLAGERITAGKLSRVVGSKTIRTANIAPITTVETLLDSVTVPLVAGRDYLIIWDGAVYSSAAGDYARLRIREDSITGTVIQLRQKHVGAGGSQAFGFSVEADYTAVATGNKTFVITMIRQSGAGNMGSQAGADSPTKFYVENA